MVFSYKQARSGQAVMVSNNPPTEEHTAFFLAGIVASAFERGIPVSAASITPTENGLTQLFMEKHVDLDALICGKAALQRKFKHPLNELWASADIAIVQATYKLSEKEMLTQITASRKQAEVTLTKHWKFVLATVKQLRKHKTLLGEHFEQLWYKTEGKLKIDKVQKLKSGARKVPRKHSGADCDC